MEDRVDIEQVVCEGGSDLVKDIIPAIHFLRTLCEPGMTEEEEVKAIMSNLPHIESLYEGFDDMKVVKVIRQTLEDYVSAGASQPPALNVRPDEGIAVSSEVYRKGMEPIRRKLQEDVGTNVQAVTEDDLLRNRLEVSRKKSRGGGFSIFNFDDLPDFEPLEVVLQLLRDKDTVVHGLNKLLVVGMDELFEHPQWPDLLSLLTGLLTESLSEECTIKTLQIMCRLFILLPPGSAQCLDALLTTLQHLWSSMSGALGVARGYSYPDRAAMARILSHRLHRTQLAVFVRAMRRIAQVSLELGTDRCAGKMIALSFLIIAHGCFPDEGNQNVPVSVLSLLPCTDILPLYDDTNELFVVDALMLHCAPVSVLCYAIHTGLVGVLTQQLKSLVMLLSSPENENLDLCRRDFVFIATLWLSVLRPFPMHAWVKHICTSDGSEAGLSVAKWKAFNEEIGQCFHAPCVVDMEGTNKKLTHLDCGYDLDTGVWCLLTKKVSEDITFTVEEFESLLTLMGGVLCSCLSFSSDCTFESKVHQISSSAQLRVLNDILTQAWHCSDLTLQNVLSVYNRCVCSSNLDTCRTICEVLTGSISKATVALRMRSREVYLLLITIVQSLFVAVVGPVCCEKIVRAVSTLVKVTGVREAAGLRKEVCSMCGATFRLLLSSDITIRVAYVAAALLNEVSMPHIFHGLDDDVRGLYDELLCYILLNTEVVREVKYVTPIIVKRYMNDTPCCLLKKICDAVSNVPESGCTTNAHQLQPVLIDITEQLGVAGLLTDTASLLFQLKKEKDSNVADESCVEMPPEEYSISNLALCLLRKSAKAESQGTPFLDLKVVLPIMLDLNSCVHLRCLLKKHFEERNISSYKFDRLLGKSLSIRDGVDGDVLLEFIIRRRLLDMFTDGNLALHHVWIAFYGEGSYDSGKEDAMMTEFCRLRSIDDSAESSELRVVQDETCGTQLCAIAENCLVDFFAAFFVLYDDLSRNVGEVYRLICEENQQSCVSTNMDADVEIFPVITEAAQLLAAAGRNLSSVGFDLVAKEVAILMSSCSSSSLERIDWYFGSVSLLIVHSKSGRLFRRHNVNSVPLGLEDEANTLLLSFRNGAMVNMLRQHGVSFYIIVRNVINNWFFGWLCTEDVLLTTLVSLLRGYDFAAIVVAAIVCDCVDKLLSVECSSKEDALEALLLGINRAPMSLRSLRGYMMDIMSVQQ
mmetsp:Transcript_4028/g.6240  ORF Transcript_4028/g.6240 Transcript_4028/m.6240 type:complete len:1201 (+) Transcript_4028:63-3665(+)